jgi:aminomethyltransferase
LGWITKFTKDFTSKEIFEKQKSNGVTKKLIGFEMIDKGIPRHDYLIVNSNNDTIGKVTSGTQSPTLGKAIGMGYVSTAHAAIGNEIFISIRNQMVKAVVVKIPFS